MACAQSIPLLSVNNIYSFFCRPLILEVRKETAIAKRNVDAGAHAIARVESIAKCVYSLLLCPQAIM